MRRARIVGLGESCYHVMSRINEHRFYLGVPEKEVFVNMMRRAADFSGVEILTFCVMSNHFHLLIRVPERKNVSDKELVQRLKALYRGNELEMLLAELKSYQKSGNEHMHALFRERYLRRMYDLSEFMSTLKQRFSIWYNRSNDRHGSLWDGRFKSVLVQASSDEWGTRALITMAAYIDLNAVRAGMVKDPKDYRWCGYAEAVAGQKRLCNGIRFVVGRGRGVPVKGNALLLYREKLFADGRNAMEGDRKLSVEERLHCRVRYLSYGMVLGSRTFVENVFFNKRACFARSGETGAYNAGLSGLCIGTRSRVGG